MCNQTKKCDECGKESQHITGCTYPINDDITNLCPQCLKDDGSFCLSCGAFCSGMTSFDFIHPGYCDNCWDEFEEAAGWDEEDANDWDPEYEDSEYNYESDCDEDFPNGSLDY